MQGALRCFRIVPVPASQELGVLCATGPACLRGVCWVYPRVLRHMYFIRHFPLFMLVFLLLLLASISIVCYISHQTRSGSLQVAPFRGVA